MSNNSENNDLRAFISRVVEDFTTLDVILHYVRSPGSQESPKSLAKLTGKEPDEIDLCLKRLVEQKVLQAVKVKGEMLYIPSKKIENSELLSKLKNCLSDSSQRTSLLATALETIRENKSRKKRRT